MTPPTPFEKALDEIIDNSIVALTEYTDNGEGVISYDHVVFDRPKLRQALLAAHTLALRIAEAKAQIEILDNIASNEDGDVWICRGGPNSDEYDEPSPYDISEYLKGWLSSADPALTPPEPKP